MFQFHFSINEARLKLWYTFSHSSAYMIQELLYMGTDFANTRARIKSKQTILPRCYLAVFLPTQISIYMTPWPSSCHFSRLCDLNMLGKIVNDDKGKNQSSLVKKTIFKKDHESKSDARQKSIHSGHIFNMYCELFRLFVLIKTVTSCLTNKPLTSRHFSLFS